MKCPCQGRPGLVLANRGDDNCEVAEYACSYCDGTGEDQRDPLWVEAGKLQRRARIEAGQTWVDWWRIWDIPPIELSDMERGLRKPLIHFLMKAEESAR